MNAVVNPDSLHLQYEEVQAVRWATLEEILRMIDDGRFIPYEKGRSNSRSSWLSCFSVMRCTCQFPNSFAVRTILSATLTPKGQRLSQPRQPMHSPA